MNKAAEITEQQKAAEIELAEAKAAWTAELDASPLTIDVAQIADIVSVTSGVPVSSLTESESRRLLQTESVLKTRIIGGTRLSRPSPRPCAAAARRSGSASPRRQLYLPGSHRHGQDRARQDARRVPLWQQGRAHQLRHVRVR